MEGNTSFSDHYLGGCMVTFRVFLVLGKLVLKEISHHKSPPVDAMVRQ